METSEAHLRSIDNLTEPDYTSKPREIINFAGERSGLMLMNPNDPTDMARVRKIEREVIDPNPIFARGKDSDEKLIQWVGREWTKGKDLYPTAPIGIVGLDKEDPINQGEILGWVNFYPSDNREVLRHQAEGDFLKQSTLPIIEVSYAKLPEAPPGNMASGLRQSCLYFLRQLTPVEKEGETQEEFESRMSSPPDLQIVADVFADNEASIKVLEASGFEKKAEAIHTKTKKPYFIYLLDWAKLHQIVQDKTWKSIRKEA